MTTKYSKDQVTAILEQLNQNFDVSIQAAQANPTKEISTLVLDLGTARPRSSAMKVSFPFKFVFVEDATDINTYVRLIPNSSDTIQDDIMLKKRDGFGMGNGIRESYLYWPAQPGKSIVLKFFVNSEFKNGSLMLDQNSVPANTQVGFARGDLDGFTRQVRFQWSGNGGSGMTYCYDINGINYNGGSLTINTVSRSAVLFKVPAGYTGEIIGGDMTTDANIVSASGALYIYALTDSSSYTLDNPAATDAIGIFAESGSLTVGAATSYNVRAYIDKGDTEFASAVNKGKVRQGIILNENEVLAFAGDTLLAANATGIIFGYVMVRLRPIVGA